MRAASRTLDPESPVYVLPYKAPGKSSEQLLSQTQASLSAIMESSTATIYALDREFRYINFNSLLKESLKQVYGLDVKIGDVVFDFLYKDNPEEAEEWRNIYSRALEGEAMQFIKEFVVGDYHGFIKFFINPIREGLLVTGLSCLALDITKEKLAELTLARNESKLRALIENNLDAIMVRDENWRLTYASPSLAKILGYEPGEIEARNGPEMLIHEEDTPALRKLYDDATSFPGVPFPTKLRLRHKMGHHIWIEGVMTNRLADEDVQGFVCNFRDITQRIEMDLQNQQISNDLVKRNANLEQFAYIVSHNLRAPIANLLGLANLLELPDADQHDRDSAVSHIISSTRRLDEVIRDLGGILETNHEVNHHRESIRFQELVDKIRSSIQSTITKNNACIQTDFSRCDRTVSIKSYMHSIFYNLISNSIKYGNANIPPVIQIRSYRDNGRLVLIFEDNGMGLDLASYGDKVFGLYKRFHTHEAEGKGIGLFMVKTQVENLGGTISIQSEVGKGTIFTINL